MITARVARITARPAGPRPTSGDTPNLYSAWLRYPPPPSCPYSSIAEPRIAIRRALGLPVLGITPDIPFPPSCGTCGAAARSPETRDDPVRPRSGGQDRWGEHAVSCGAHGIVKARHDILCAAIRRAARRARWDPDSAADFRFSSGRGRLQPADVYLANHPSFPAGAAIDVTIVSRWANTPARAEAAKHAKYDRQVAARPGLGFLPMAFDLDGGIGPEAWRTIQDIARHIAAIPDNVVTYHEALRDMLSDLGHTLVATSAAQIRRAAGPGAHRPAPCPPPRRPPRLRSRRAVVEGTTSDDDDQDKPTSPRPIRSLEAQHLTLRPGPPGQPRTTAEAPSAHHAGPRPCEHLIPTVPTDAHTSIRTDLSDSGSSSPTQALSPSPPA